MLKQMLEVSFEVSACGLAIAALSRGHRIKKQHVEEPGLKQITAKRRSVCSSPGLPLRLWTRHPGRRDIEGQNVGTAQPEFFAAAGTHFVQAFKQCG